MVGVKGRGQQCGVLCEATKAAKGRATSSLRGGLHSACYAAQLAEDEG